MSNYSPTDVQSDQSGRHPVNVGHLVMGVAFLGLATIWVLFESSSIGTTDLRWFLPIPWLAAGLAGLLAVALTGRRSRPEEMPTAPPTWAESEPDATWADDPSERSS